MVREFLLEMVGLARVAPESCSESSCTTAIVAPPKLPSLLIVLIVVAPAPLGAKREVPLGLKTRVAVLVSPGGDTACFLFR